jgi:hypothetical protein
VPEAPSLPRQFALTSALRADLHSRLDHDGGDASSNSTDVRLTRQKSALFQWLAVPLWFPTDKDSLPTDSGFGGIPFECFSTRRPAWSAALGGLIHILTQYSQHRL